MNKRRHPLLKICFLFAFFAIVIHIINKIVSALAVFKNISTTKGGEYYNWRFGNIFYTKQGSGSPILLIHNLTPSGSLAEWDSIVTKLSENYTVYTLDLLGCGLSDKPKITYTNFLYVQLITDFVKNVIGQKTNIIASGLSGSFTVMACAQDEDIFDKVMLISPEDIGSLSQIPTRNSKIAKWLLELPLVGTLAYNIITSKSNIGLLFTEKYLHNPFDLKQSTIDIHHEAAHTKSGSGKYLLSSIIGKYIHFNISHGLKSINNSLFIITGEHHADVNEIIARYTLLNPALEHETISQSKSLPHYENPAQLLELVQTFF